MRITTASVWSLLVASIALFLGVNSALGQVELDEAKVLFQKATELYQAGKYAEAIPLEHRLLAIAEKTVGPDHPGVATVLNQLALLYESMGDYAKAEPLYRRALAIDEKALGPDDPKVAAVLNNWAVLYQTMGDLTKAEPLFRRALGIKEKELGPDHPDVAPMLGNLAVLYRAMGAYAKAEPLSLRALAISEKALGPVHPQVATSLNNLAELYRNMGAYARAHPLYRRSLAIMEKALGPNHPSVATSINNLGLLYQAMGVYAKAELLFLRALVIMEKAVGPEHPSVAMPLNNLALLYQAMGNYAKAEPLLQRSLAIREKALGSDHPDVAASLNNLAEMYRAIGDYARAVRLHQRSLGIKEKALGPEHLDVALSLNNLALLYQAIGAYAMAETLYQRSLPIMEKALGPDHPNLATAFNNMAELYHSIGVYATAEWLHQRSLAIREKALGPHHPDVAMSLNNLAWLYQTMGTHTKAEPLYERSLAIQEKTLGPDHPDVAVSLYNLAALEAAQQHHQSAIGFFKRGLAIQDRQIRDIFAFTTEEQKLTFMQSLSRASHGFLSLIYQHFGADRVVVREGLELVLRRKGIVLDAQSRAREALQGRLSEAARTEWDRLSEFRGELSQVLLNKPKTMTPAEYQETVASLRQQIEQSEQWLAKESALVAKELQQRTTTVAAISKRLPKNSLLVEFVNVEDFDFSKDKSAGSSRYLAFILSASGDVSLIDLGDAIVLESQVRRALQDIKVSMESRNLKVLKKTDRASSTQRGVSSLNDLYRRLWAPLRKALGRADQVVVSPDGLLNLVPFAALIDDQGRALVESYRLVYVSSGRELVGPEESPVKPESDLLLVANPAFDGVVEKTTGQASLRSRDFQGAFSPLPGTEREAKEIPPLVRGRGGQHRVLVGTDATEHVVKTTRSPHVLHLATHGFFLQDEEMGVSAGTRDLKVVKSETQAPPKKYENPLVRSGLAFAGANRASGITEGDDGILTALEITGMDLFGTELVVLSACATGVGEIKTGEGVFGLRRAFALAGAKNLLMSLWPVSDEITANQMNAFYRNLQTLPPADALRQAQLDTIKELKAEFGTASPALWAPFILQGSQALGQ